MMSAFHSKADVIRLYLYLSFHVFLFECYSEAFEFLQYVSSSVVAVAAQTNHTLVFILLITSS